LVSHQLEALLHFEAGEELDFTPGVICLAKVFEKEANLSIVHWARRELGVSLPQFFNKPQPGVRAIVIPQIPDGREIDLNVGRRGKVAGARYWGSLNSRARSCPGLGYRTTGAEMTGICCSAFGDRCGRSGTRLHILI